jgi:MoaE-MoaD fusion protein
MIVRVRLFAALKEVAGSDSVELELLEGATVGDALEALGSHPPLAALLAQLPVGMAVNREYVGAETPLAADDELALIPPISGGAGPHVRVTAEPLLLSGVSAAVADPRAGAIVIFQGVTREIERLEYEAYREMAEERITVILTECNERHGLFGSAAEHRIGTVPLGEPAVVVAVSAAHREEAFAGAREAIDRIKAEAPIWKREVKRDGTASWIEGERPPVDPNQHREATR